MSSTYKQRYLGTQKENRVQYKFTGQLRMLQVCLDYEGTQSPLSCTVDGDNIKQIAAKSGATDIVSLYDNGSTPLYPTKNNVINQFVQMCQRCEEGDFICFQFSGHGTHQEDYDGDESDGQDEALCLRDQNGQIQNLIDDEIAELVSEHLNPEIPCLFMVDACHSGTVVDLQKGGIWGGLKVFLLSGCQDQQFSGDTGNGGVMTHALLAVLKKKATKKKRKKRNASIQYIFNRMVEEMPEQEVQEEEGMQEEDYEYVEGEQLVFDFLDLDLEQGQFDDWEEQEEAQGQTINLSWCGGTDPTLVQFPF